MKKLDLEDILNVIGVYLIVLPMALVLASCCVKLILCMWDMR